MEIKHIWLFSNNSAVHGFILILLFMVLFCSYCFYLYKDKYLPWATFPYIYRYLHEYFAHESFTHWPDIVISYCPQLLFFKSSFEFQKVIKASHLSFWPLESQKFLVLLILHLNKCLFIHQKRYTLLSFISKTKLPIGRTQMKREGTWSYLGESSDVAVISISQKSKSFSWFLETPV